MGVSRSGSAWYAQVKFGEAERGMGFVVMRDAVRSGRAG